MNQPLQVTNDTTGGTVLTDTSGRQAKVVGGPAPRVLADCDVAVYVLDAVRASGRAASAWEGLLGAALRAAAGVQDEAGTGRPSAPVALMAANPRLVPWARILIASGRAAVLLTWHVSLSPSLAGAHACQRIAAAASHHCGSGPRRAGCD